MLFLCFTILSLVTYTLFELLIFFLSYLFDISYRKLLRLFAFEVLEVKLDFSHILLHIARRLDDLGTLDEFLLIVQGIEMDRDASLEGYKIKALLPVGVERACALGRNAEPEGIALLRLGSQVVGHAGVLAAPYRYAAHLAEDRPQRPEKPFLLHEEVALHALGMLKELPQEEVPVAGMRS